MRIKVNLFLTLNGSQKGEPSHSPPAGLSSIAFGVLQCSMSFRQPQAVFLTHTHTGSSFSFVLLSPWKVQSRLITPFGLLPVLFAAKIPALQGQVLAGWQVRKGRQAGALWNCTCCAPAVSPPAAPGFKCSHHFRPPTKPRHWLSCVFHLEW